VWTRTDAQKKGKGYAIEFAVERLKDDPPEVVILIDSDCRVSSGAINLLSRAAATYRRPIQALYLMNPPAVSGVLTYVSTFAYLVRNLVRPLGLHKLGLPCHLTGTGMAFLWEQLLTIPPQRSNLVEDLSMGLEAAINGYPPMLLKEAEVRSEFPESLPAAAAQRRRWEHGQLATAWALVPRLIIEGVRQRRADILGLAADLIVPPLSLLVLLIGAAALTSLITYNISGSPVALTINLLALLLVGLATIASWVRFARKVIPGRALVLAPFYLLWKLPIYAALLIGRRQKAWIRTERTSGKCRNMDNKEQ
jgi:cellulose synthase/poly-beta-1,6-N-acetylglucosamine synthase-like glycosyltransferase